MSTTKWTASLMLCLPVAMAQMALPELRIEATTGGSILYVRNTAPQPLTAFLIELVGYPGSSYAFAQDDLDTPIAPGTEKRFPITNMTVGAVPEYVKMRAAIYADGSSSGIAEKVAQIVERRRTVLETTRELIRRLEAGSDLRAWADSMKPGAARSLVLDTAKKAPADALAGLRAGERKLAASKPPLQ